MYCFIACFLEEAGTADPEPVAPEEGSEPKLPEVDLLCQESFNEGKSILPLMHKLPILSLPLPRPGIMGVYCMVSKRWPSINIYILDTRYGLGRRAMGFSK
jgi:hypothetical protein